MKRILAVIGSIICGVLAWLIGRGIGDVIYDAYKGTGDMVTASENIGLTVVFPIMIGIVSSLIAYHLIKD